MSDLEIRTCIVIVSMGIVGIIYALFRIAERLEFLLGELARTRMQIKWASGMKGAFDADHELAKEASRRNDEIVMEYEAMLARQKEKKAK